MDLSTQDIYGSFIIGVAVEETALTHFLYWEFPWSASIFYFYALTTKLYTASWGLVFLLLVYAIYSYYHIMAHNTLFLFDLWYMTSMNMLIFLFS